MLHDVSGRSSSVVSGRYFGGIALELFEEDAVSRDLAERLAIGRTRHRDADRARRAMAREADDTHVVAEVLAAELRADAELRGELEDLRLELVIAEATAELVAGGRQRVEVVRRSRTWPP